MADNTFIVHKGLTMRPVSADPANAVDGDVQFSDGTHRPKGLWEYKDGAWSRVGGGGGSLDLIDTETFEALSTSEFTTGNNANYLTAGSFGGTLSDETVSPLKGNTSAKYTAGVSSSNDWFDIKTVDINLKERGELAGCSFAIDMSSFGSNDITFVVYDRTNSEKLTLYSTDQITAGSAKQQFHVTYDIPSNCTQISYGFHMDNGATNTESFLVDEFEHKLNPVYIADQSIDEMINYQSGSSRDGSGFILYSTETENTSKGVITVTNSGHTRYTFDKIATFTAATSYNGAAGNLEIRHYDSSDTLLKTSQSSVGNTTGEQANILQGLASIGDYIVVETDGPTPSPNNLNNFSIRATVRETNIIVPGEANLTEWANYTPTIEGMGTPTSLDFKYRIVGDTLYVRGSGVAGTVSATNVTFSIPSGFNIDNNKLRTSDSRNALGRAFRMNAATYSYGDSGNTAMIFSDGTESSKVFITRDLFPSTTTVTKSTGSGWMASSDGFMVDFEVPLSGMTSSRFLVSLPTEKYAVITHNEASGVNGGSISTTGTWLTSTLNTVTGDNFVTVTSNQFTLPAGEYILEGFQVAGDGPGALRGRVRNITDSTDLVVGNTAYGSTAASSPDEIKSEFFVKFKLIESKTFELQHRVTATGIIGLASSAGVDEIYETIRIRKLA